MKSSSNNSIIFQVEFQTSKKSIEFEIGSNFKFLIESNSNLIIYQLNSIIRDSTCRRIG